MSNGGQGPNSPRHSRVVATWRNSLSSVNATMQRTFGRSPSPISYSKSTTVMLRKQSAGPGRTASGQILLGGDQAEQARVIFGVDEKSLVTGVGVETDPDDFLQRMRSPFRFGEGVGVAGLVDLVALDILGLARGRLHP